MFDIGARLRARDETFPFSSGVDEVIDCNTAPPQVSVSLVGIGSSSADAFTAPSREVNDLFHVSYEVRWTTSQCGRQLEDNDYRWLILASLHEAYVIPLNIGF